jgi:hypothetical protein
MIMFPIEIVYPVDRLLDHHFLDIQLPLRVIPSAKRLHFAMENHHFNGENQLFRLGHVQ